jgi:hypothetical protein
MRAGLSGPARSGEHQPKAPSRTARQERTLSGNCAPRWDLVLNADSVDTDAVDAASTASSAVGQSYLEVVIMARYAQSDAESAFLKAVGDVFAEHREVSARFGLCDVNQLTELFAQGQRQRFGLRRNDSGGVTAVFESQAAADAEEISPTFPASVQDPFAGPINPFTGEPEGACLAVVPELTGEGLVWGCLVYLTS